MHGQVFPFPYTSGASLLFRDDNADGAPHLAFVCNSNTAAQILLAESQDGITWAKPKNASKVRRCGVHALRFHAHVRLLHYHRCRHQCQRHHHRYFHYHSGHTRGLAFPTSFLLRNPTRFSFPLASFSLTLLFPFSCCYTPFHSIDVSDLSFLPQSVFMEGRPGCWDSAGVAAGEVW
jgi:hypothetical protein